MKLTSSRRRHSVSTDNTHHAWVVLTWLWLATSVVVMVQGLKEPSLLHQNRQRRRRLKKERITPAPTVSSQPSPPPTASPAPTATKSEAPTTSPPTARPTPSPTTSASPTAGPTASRFPTLAPVVVTPPPTAENAGISVTPPTPAPVPLTQMPILDLVDFDLTLLSSDQDINTTELTAALQDYLWVGMNETFEVQRLVVWLNENKRQRRNLLLQKARQLQTETTFNFGGQVTTQTPPTLDELHALQTTLLNDQAALEKALGLSSSMTQLVAVEIDDTSTTTDRGPGFAEEDHDNFDDDTENSTKLKGSLAGGLAFAAVAALALLAMSRRRKPRDADGVVLIDPLDDSSSEASSSHQNKTTPLGIQPSPNQEHVLLSSDSESCGDSIEAAVASTESDSQVVSIASPLGNMMPPLDEGAEDTDDGSFGGAPAAANKNTLTPPPSPPAGNNNKWLSASPTTKLAMSNPMITPARSEDSTDTEQSSFLNITQDGSVLNTNITAGATIAGALSSPTDHNNNTTLPPPSAAAAAAAATALTAPSPMNTPTWNAVFTPGTSDPTTLHRTPMLSRSSPKSSNNSSPNAAGLTPTTTVSATSPNMPTPVTSNKNDNQTSKPPLDEGVPGEDDAVVRSSPTSSPPRPTTVPTTSLLPKPSQSDDEDDELRLAAVSPLSEWQGSSVFSPTGAATRSVVNKPDAAALLLDDDDNAPKDGPSPTSTATTTTTSSPVVVSPASSQQPSGENKSNNPSDSEAADEPFDERSADVDDLQELVDQVERAKAAAKLPSFPKAESTGPAAAAAAAATSSTAATAANNKSNTSEALAAARQVVAKSDAPEDEVLSHYLKERRRAAQEAREQGLISSRGSADEQD